ncbi:MAG TPA: hypothetical protein PKM63_13235 [Panacibacter sp.]|nr:hypothetical protein [Panacibacter sp.]HNP45246.1 hypothetical protein [Panacibacter sp.]
MITSKQTNGRKPKASFSETVRNNQMKFRFSSNSLDIIVKVAGILTIFIPLLLFYKQQEAENTRNWTEKKANEYSDLLVSIHKLEKTALFSKAFEEAHNTIFYEVYPRLLIFNDKEILNKVDSLRSLDVFLLQSKDVLEKLNETDSLAIVLLDSAGLNTEQYSSLYYRLGMPSLFYYFKGTSESFTKQYADNSNEFIKKYSGKLDSLFGSYSKKLQSLEDHETIQRLDFTSTADYIVNNSSFFGLGMSVEGRVELFKRIDELDSLIIHNIKNQ